MMHSGRSSWGVVRMEFIYDRKMVSAARKDRITTTLKWHVSRYSLHIFQKDGKSRFEETNNINSIAIVYMKIGI